MKYLVLFIILIIILQSYRLSIVFLRKDVNLLKKMFETLILVFLIFLSFFNLIFENHITIYLSLFIAIYTVIMFIIEIKNKNNYVSVLSVKNSIDMASCGILFLKNKNKKILINNVMDSILHNLNINKDYINNFKKYSFNKNFIKIDEKVYQLNIISNKQIILYDVTSIYNLQEKEELQNKIIEKNNKKIQNTIENIEKIEKEKNLLTIKNEYHDILGHRLALLTSYLNQNKFNKNDIKFIVNITFNENCGNSKNKLNDLIKMYYLVGVNIKYKGDLKYDKDISSVLFEIIREAITNAIIHANSKNIEISLADYEDKIEMIIKNDGLKNKNVIIENEGIKGMKRKLLNINGTLLIDNSDNFTLKVCIKNRKEI